MHRASRLALPVAVLIGALAGAGQQRRQAPHPIAPPAPTLPTPYTEAIRDNNLGIALMDRQEFQEALGKFQTACIMNPSSDTSCLDIGIALLNMKQYEAAENILMKSAERDPANPLVWFNLGLLARIGGQQDVALMDFEKVAMLDPQDADTQYMIGLVNSENGQDEQAIAAFENAIKSDRFHASAELALAQAEERQGEIDDASTHLNRFRQLLASNLAHQISTIYGEEGKYSLAEELSPDAAPVGTAIPVHFINVTADSGLPAEGVTKASIDERTSRGRRKKAASGTKVTNVDQGSSNPTTPKSLAEFLGSGACVIDYDGDGRPDIFLVNADGKGNAALYRNAGRGKFVDVTKAANLAFHGDGTGCAVGDYDNDGHPDIALSSNARVVLYRNTGNGKFEDVTDAAGIHTNGLSLGITFIDYDRDGHLDLYVTRFNNFPIEDAGQPFAFSTDTVFPGNVLWRNKGDGTFEDRTAMLAVGGASPSIGAVGSDLNNDRSTDIVLTGWGKPPSILLNQLEGPFQPTDPWTSTMPGTAAGIVAMDFDSDRWMDLVFTHWAPPGLSLWRNIHGTSFDRVNLPDTGWMRGWGLSALDYDNDGRPDIVAVGETFSGEGRIALLRNEGDKGFRDVTHETGLDIVTLHNPRSVIAFDYNGDGATDLLITQNDLPPVLLENVGAQKNDWLQLTLKGTGENRGAIGAEVTLFSGAQRQKWDVTGASGYLGQNSTDIIAGLGSEKSADVVRIRWPKGLLQNELLVNGGSQKEVLEIDRSVNSPKP